MATTEVLDEAPGLRVVGHPNGQRPRCCGNLVGGPLETSDLVRGQDFPEDDHPVPLIRSDLSFRRVHPTSQARVRAYTGDGGTAARTTEQAPT